MRTPVTGLPPGPPLPAPLFTLLWTRKAQRVLTQLRKRYGDTFTVRLAYEGTWVVTANPEYVKSVFRGDPQVLHAGEGNAVLGPVLGEHSLLLLDDEPHLRQRKLLLPPFHGERMQRYGELITAITQAELARWPTDRPYRVRPRMQELTLEVILRAVFGLADGEQLTALRDAIRNLLTFLTKPNRVLFLLLAGPRFLNAVRPFKERLERVDHLLYAEIAARRNHDLSNREDIMSLLLQATDEEGRPMSEREVRDELMTLLLAGHETTANALAWAVERLAHHPERLARLREELGGGQRDYLKAVVYETLRLRPVISIVVRKVKAPFQLGPYLLPPGVSIVPAIYLMHRREDIYPAPEEFMPERFLEHPPGTYTWIPFGGGIRRCLGAAFAQFEMETVLDQLVRRFDLKPARKGAEPVLRRSITETPARDAEVVLRPLHAVAEPAFSGQGG